MKFEIVSQSFLKALSVVMRSVTSRAQLPILANVLLTAHKGGIEMVSTDLEMSFRVKVGARVSEEGRITVPAKVLFEFISTIKDGVLEVATNGESLEIIGTNMNSSFQTINAEEYPEVPMFEGDSDIVVDSDIFVESLNRVAVAASKDDSRPVFTGVMWKIIGDTVELVATDGYRLTKANLKVGIKEGLETKPMVVPARALVELGRVIGKESKEKVEVRLQTESSQVIFRVGEIELVSRLLGGEFPAYDKLIPVEASIRVLVKKDEMLEAIKRASIFARDNANIVRFDFGESEIKVSARSPQMGKNETHVACSGQSTVMATAFNFRYLIDCLSVLDDSEFRFESAGSLKPGIFRGKDDSYLHVIMSMKLPD